MPNHRSRLTAAALGAALALSAGALSASGLQDTDTTATAEVASGHHHGARAAAPAQAASARDHAVPGRLQAQMRRLWNQHMNWTWATVVAFAEDSPSLPAHLNRLLDNQQDIGDSIAPFYGAEAGQALADELTIHINLAVPVLTAAKNGDTAALQTALDDWYANAEDIADFLSTANPDSWPQEATREMMKGHIDTTVVYASAVLSGDYPAAAAAFDEAKAHMMHMADALALGIATQFPDAF